MSKQDFTPSSEEITAWLSLAAEKLKAAKMQLNEQLYRSAISDSYYAAFYVAKAALLSLGFITKSHSGTVKLFGEQFIKTGKVAKNYGQWLSFLQELRTEADYEALVKFNHEQAAEAVTKAELFIKAVKSLIS